MFSIIIPTLNEENYLPLLLESINPHTKRALCSAQKNEICARYGVGVKKQNFSDYEIIVADAGSKDKTLEIAKKYGCKIVKGGSVAKGRNEGAKIAQGNLFLFLDADVVLTSSNFLEELLKKFKKRNLDVASFLVLPRGKTIDKVLYWFYNCWALLTQSFLPHATEVILVKKEIHQLSRGFDEEIKIAEDHAYVRKASKFGKYGFIKIKPVLTSTRRFERDGRLKTYLKYFLAGLYLLFLGPVKSDIFKYKFNHYFTEKKK